jgi:hypothetical protein
MTEKTIPAHEVKPGQTIVEYAYTGLTKFRRLPKGRRVAADRVRGRLPVVTEVEYRERGEDNLPTVYVKTDQAPAGKLCFLPDTQVTVREG